MVSEPIILLELTYVWKSEAQEETFVRHNYQALLEITFRAFWQNSVRYVRSVQN
jgi:hypothetical protein